MQPPSSALIDQIRSSSRLMVRELGFMQGTLAQTAYSPSSVHAILEIGAQGSLSGVELATVLGLEKSSVSRLVQKLIATAEIEEAADERDARSKRLRLTAKGMGTLASIHEFARAQVTAALGHLGEQQQRTVSEGLAGYAQALRAQRLGLEPIPAKPLTIARGYRPGLIGRMTQMHASYYARHAGFGQAFESLVATDMAELMGRLNHPHNEVWAVLDEDRIVGSIAIDGEREGNNEALLRCFILDDCARGQGVGKRLLAQAMSFCDECGFDATRLWTFKGLDAARKLYEEVGFTLVLEQEGQQWGGPVMEQCFVRHLPA